MFADVRAIVFDLDGTLYVNDGLAREIKTSACRYIAALNAIDVLAAKSLLDATRKRLSVESGLESTISAACMEVGGDLRRLHDHFSEDIRPEKFLDRDDLLVTVLGRLAGFLDLYVYTNNNRILSGRILELLGISGLFRRVFTIEDSWRPKPDISSLRQVYAGIGRPPEACAFVGDRYDVDLRLPASHGSPVYLVGSVRELTGLLQKIADHKE